MAHYYVENERGQLYVLAAESATVRNGHLIFWGEQSGAGTARDPLVTETLAAYAPGAWKRFWRD